MEQSREKGSPATEHSQQRLIVRGGQVFQVRLHTSLFATIWLQRLVIRVYAARN